MATSKKASTKERAANVNENIAEAARHGLNGFDDKTVAALIIEAHERASEASTAADAKAQAAYNVCCVAQRLRRENDTLDREAWSTAWRASMKGILPRLHAAGVSWVEQTERTLKDGTVKAGFKLTSYGQNISSDASRTGAYNIDAESLESLTQVRGAIKAAIEAEAAEEMTDEQKLCREMDDTLVEGFKVLRKLLSDAESVDAYQGALDTMAELLAQNTPEGEAVPEIEAKKAA